MDDKKLYRIYVLMQTTDQWYAVMRECRSWFGRNWRTQGRIKRKLQSKYSRLSQIIPVWFEVPDLRFATWISVKLSLQVQGEDKFKAAK